MRPERDAVPPKFTSASSARNAWPSRSGHVRHTHNQAPAGRYPRRGFLPTRAAPGRPQGASRRPARRADSRGSSAAPPPSRMSLPRGGLARPLQRRLDAVGHEVEGRAAGHVSGARAWWVSTKTRNVVGRVVAPPAFPGSSGHGPRTGPNMLRPMIQAPRFSKPRAAKSSSMPVAPPSLAVHLLERARGTNHPCSALAADAERI